MVFLDGGYQAQLQSVDQLLLGSLETDPGVPAGQQSETSHKRWQKSFRHTWAKKNTALEEKVSK